MNSNVRPHNFISQHARHHPSSLRPAFYFERRTRKSQISAREAMTGSASFLLSAGPTQQRLVHQSQASASHESARLGPGLERVSLSFRRRAESPAFDQLGQRRRDETETTLITQRLVTVTQAALFPALGFAVRPNYIVQPGPATAGVASPVRACRNMVADRACNARLRGPG